MLNSNDHSFAHISCSIAPRTKIQVSIPMFSMSRNILAMSEFTSGAAIFDFKMSAMCGYFYPNCVIFSILFYYTVELLYHYTK